MRRMQPQFRSAALRSSRPIKHWPLKPLARAIAAAGLLASTLGLQAAPPASNALPTGLQVSAGQASVLTQGSQMTVRNSNGAILNWSSFNIGAAAGVYFDQASAASKVLNRVTGNDPTQVFGSLASNGQVWLLNPNGVLFGQGARVDVAGLVTSTLRLNDSDFLNGQGSGQTSGRYRFTGDAGSTATVRNEGRIQSAHGGQVLLLAAQVENTGTVQANGGNVTLASARSVELVDTGLPHLAVRVDVPAGEVLNMGRLVADGGTVDVFGAIVNQQGLVQADTLAVDVQGRVTLKASDTLMLGTGSTTQARGMAAGSTGGSVDLLGTNVGLAGTASVDVSGVAAGGGIRVGGGLQGRDNSVPNAQAVWVGPGATLRADATGAAGDGGRIILWSDTATRAYGTLSARGGSTSGAGGFVETSGGWLDARPAWVDVSSRSGLAGSWLLDPNDILITSSGSDTHISGGPNFTSTNDSSVITTATLAAALNAGTSVTVSTGAAGSNSQAGDILMSGATLAVTPTQGVTLTLQAARDIVVNSSSISSSTQPLNLSLVAAGSGQGAIELINSSITTAGGNVTLGGTTPRTLTLPDGTQSAQVNPALGYVNFSSNPSLTSSSGLIGVNVEASTLNLGSGSFTAAGSTSAVGSPGLALGSLSNATTTINAASINLLGHNDATGTSPSEAGLRILGEGTALNATQQLRLEGNGRSGVEVGQGARLSLAAAAGSGASFTIVGRSSDGNAVELDADNLRSALPGTGTRLTASNADFSITADSTANAALVMVNDHGAPGPLLDLAGATSASFVVPRSASTIEWGNSSLGLGAVDLVLPATGATSFSSDVGVGFFQTIVTAGSGTVSISGPQLTLFNSLVVGSGASFEFATTGATPLGARLVNTTLLTGNGDVRFGAVQNVNSSVLGNTTTPARWLEYASTDAAPALSLNGSTIDAGTGQIVGGGAGRGTGSGGGVEIFQSNLNARQINLAGRSDTEIGLLVDGSTLFADRVLKLDGLSAGTSLNSGAGLYVFQGSTLQVSDAGNNAGSQMTLSGKNITGYVGVLMEGGDAGTANETRLIVSGAALDIRGDGPVSGGAGVVMTGTTSAPGGLLVNALGATSVLVDGSTSSGSGGGLKMQYATVLGAQATGTAPLVLRSSGQQVNGAPALWIDNSTITTGGTLTVQGDGMVITSSGLTGESGVSLLSNTGAGAPAAGPVLLDANIIMAPGPGAQVLVQGTAGDAVRGDASFQGGTGVTLTNGNGILATGAGGSIVIRGQGAATGGTGVDFSRSAFQAANVSITGTGLVLGDGVFAEDLTGGFNTRVLADNLTITGTGADSTTTPSKVGVRLGANVQLNFGVTGGTGLITGDNILLGNVSGATPAFRVTGSPDSFSVRSTDSLRIVNSSVDFLTAGRPGTAVHVVADSDAAGGGRVRMENSLLQTGGANLTVSGQGVVRNLTTAPQNTSVREGAVGVYLVDSSFSTGSGTASISGSGPVAGAAQGTNAGLAGVMAQGANSITGGQINITGHGGDYGAGIDVGVNQAGATLALQANSISLTGTGTGTDPATLQTYAGVQVASSATNTWTVLNPGTGLNTAPLTVTSTAGPMTLNNLVVNTGRLTLNSAGAIGMTGSSFTAADSADLTATGTPLNNTLILVRNGSLNAGGTLQLSGTATSTGLGVAFQSGSSASGSTVTISGTGMGEVGVGFSDNSGSNSITATSGALSITGRSDTAQGVGLLGAWTLSTPTTLSVDSNNGLLQVVGASSGQAQTFTAGQSLNLNVLAPAGLALGTGQALDSGLLTAAVSGMSASSTVDISTSAGLTSSGALTVPGRLVLRADNLTLQAGTALGGNATGDAVVLRGASGSAVSNFTNTAGAGALSAPNGRWVLLAADPRQTTLGGLQPAFSAYDLAAQPWSTDTQGNYVTPAAGHALGYGISTAALNGQGLTGLLSKVYDATTRITLNPSTWSISGLVSGDTLSFTGSNVGTLADKNVGTARPVTIGSTTFSVQDAGGRPVFGYSTPSFTANVTPLSVSLTGTTAANKVYDGNTTGTFSSLGSVTPLAGDSLAVGGTATATFSDKNVGTAKTVAVSGFALTGADAGNYTLVAPSTLTADIGALALTVTGLSAQSRVYDTTTTATLAGTASVNTVAGDTVALAGTPSASFADKNVGTAKPVTVTGYALTGTDAGNYTLAQPAGLTADITAAQVSLTGLTAQSKVYDTTTSASFLGTASVTPLAGDALTLAGTAAGGFSDKNVGTAKPVALSGLSPAGADAGNYTLVVPAFTANIAPASLGLLNLAAANKTYDNTRTATVSGTLTGVLSGDAVNLGLTGQFSDANVGNAKTVAWVATAAGTDAGNYVLAPATGAVQANITPATLTYTASPVAGTVGQTLPVLMGNVSGFLGTDTLAGATTGTLGWTTAATVASSVGQYAVTGGGLAALNYVFAQAAGNATALTLQAATTADVSTTATTVVTTAALFSVQLPVTMSSPTQGRVLDVTTAFAPAGSAADGMALRSSSSGRADVGGAVPAAATATTTPTAATDIPAGQATGQAPGVAATTSPVPGSAAGDTTPNATSTAAATSPGAPAVPLTVEQGIAVALRSAGEAAGGIAFRALDLSRLPREEVQSLLAARARYKQKVFSKGVFRLQQDPTLADVRACSTEAELDSGICIVTEQLKQEIQAARAARAAQSTTPRVERARRGVKQAALPVIQRKLALVVGINKYDDKNIPELVGSVPDARAVRQILDSRMGYETTVLENASREQIVRALNKLALEAEAHDSVIVYYAGHGVLVPVAGVDTGYWLPSDVDAEAPASWLSNADIARMVAAISARQVMLVSDSCYSGQLVGKDRVQLSNASDAGELLKRRAAVVMSSGGDEPVADQGREGHSVFAWHFMRALEDLTQWQVGGSLYQRVRAGVVKDFPQTPQYGANRGAGHQGDTDYLFERRELEALKP